MDFPQLSMTLPDGREESIMKRTTLVRHLLDSSQETRWACQVLIRDSCVHGGTSSIMLRKRQTAECSSGWTIHLCLPMSLCVHHSLSE